MKGSCPKKYVLSVMFLCLCLANFGCVPCKALPSEEVKESIYIDVFIGAIPTGEITITKNAHLRIGNITGLPVDTGLPAFNDGFISAESEITGGNPCFLGTRVFYNLSQVTNETANQYADVVASEFMNALNYSMPSFNRSQIIDNETHTVKIFRDFGWMEYSVANMKSFMQYKPTEGLGKLINSFLHKYVPGTGSGMMGLIDLYYNVKKVGSTFLWEFVIGGSDSEAISNNVEETIDLNEMINNSLPIQASAKESEIVVDIWKTAEGDSYVYTFDIKDMQPSGYAIMDDSTDLVRKYEDLTTPLSNVVVEFDVTRTDKPLISDFLLELIAIVIIVVVVLASVVFIHKRRKKIRKQSETDKGSLP